MKQSFIVILGTIVLTVTACGPSAMEGQSLFERSVPVAETNDEGLVSEPVTEVAPEEKAPSERVLLRDKVLSNSSLSERAVDNAFAYFDSNKSRISNKNVITIFDIAKHSGKRRMHVIYLKTGKVTSIHVAHGKNSDVNHNGYAESFSNKHGSLQSSLGFMITGKTYHGSKGYSLNLHGQESRNSEVYDRRIIIHGASYVSPSLSKMGRSWGCPSVSWANTKWLIDTIKNGSLLYIYNAKYDG